MGFLGTLQRRVFGSTASTIRTGPAAGLRFDPGPSNPAYATGDNELPVQQLLQQRLRPGAVLFDIGANVGFLSVVGARLVGSAGLVYAFEPVPANAALVRRNATINHLDQIQVIEIAVGDRSGTAKLVLAEYSGGAALAGVDPPPDAAGEIEVEVATVDQLVERGYRPPSFVKIDVEGAELLVLKGMEQVCTRNRPDILYELDGPTEEALEVKRVECEQWLLAHGYGVVELPRSYEGNRWCVRHFVATHEQPRPTC